jgi:transcriptional regulator with XRE-family HTH domain
MDIDAYISILRDRLADCSLTREQLASRTGGALSASWLSKFAAGHMSNPRADSLKALDAALSSCEQQAA